MPVVNRNSCLPMKHQFEEEGYAIFRDALDRDLMEEARRHLAWLGAKNPGVRPEHLGSQFLEVDAFWLRLVSDARLLDIAQQFIGPDIALFGAHYLAKPAFDGQQ